MGPSLGGQSTASESQITTHRMGGARVSQKESWVTRSGKMMPMLGMTGGDSGVFEKVQSSAQVTRWSMLWKAGGFLNKGVSGTVSFLFCSLSV